ncbi:hypothetical protein, conserved [Eimeria praecox]|uniref:Man1/Src1-like C-terminal domain-containing protein n=1 Tax=Eimeria praecox TaxID=51316 RepID=U6G5P9_9EIME|nr:hypothetical protein, conserved [Eimeria praecox]
MHAADEATRPPTQKQGTRVKQAPTVWALLLRVAVVATFVLPRLPRAEVAPGDSLPVKKELKAEAEDDTVYCNSGHIRDDANDNQECVPCPPNAECAGGKMACLPGYTSRQRKRGHQPPPNACVDDGEKKARAAEVLKSLVEILRERQGRYDCGYPVDPLFSPSEQLGGKPWSNVITKMCSGPGLTRWQMYFHRDIGPALEDEGVYFWLFYHFLVPEAAAQVDIQVSKAD